MSIRIEEEVMFYEGKFGDQYSEKENRRC